MSAPTFFDIEQPIRSNSMLYALDEQAGRIALAEFAFEQASRLTFSWPRDHVEFDSDSQRLLTELAAAVGGTARCVAAWNHDDSGMFRMQHKILCSRLAAANWRAVVREGLGIAMSAEARDFNAEIDLARQLRLGWLVAYGDWATPELLSAPPFEATMSFFGANSRLAPSREFLTGLVERGGALAYSLKGDERFPSTVLVTTKSISHSLHALTERATPAQLET